jgi:hypothetical protein
MKRKIDTEIDDDLFLIDLLLDSNLSLPEIAKELDVSIKDLNKKINHLGLNWIKQQKKKTSRGQAALTSVMKKLLPNEKIINEYHLGDRLRLDVYCPSYKLAAEFHGRQHFYYTERFFDSKYDFEEAQKRDVIKMQMCKDQGIALVVFRYNDLLTEESVYSRILTAIRDSQWKEKEPNPLKKKVTDSEFYQEQKRKKSEQNKKLYREMKQRKKNQ